MYLTSGKILEKTSLLYNWGEKDTEKIYSNSGIVENMRSKILAIIKIIYRAYPKYCSSYLNIYGIVRALSK